MATNSQEYYNDSSLHGNYQYINLEEIIDELQMIKGKNQFLRSIPRAEFIMYAKRTLREFNLDLTQEVKAIELEINDTLNLVLPEDFLSYVRISYIDENGELRPIAQSNSLLIAKSYLQDNDGNILFDNDGNILSTDLTDTFVNPPNTDRSFTYGYSFSPNADLTKSNPNKFRLDRDRGLIQFNSSVEGKNVVLEYVSDGLYNNFGGLDDSDIRVNKILEEAIIDAVYYKSIKHNSDAPEYEKRTAKKNYFNSKRLAKRRMNTLRKDEVIQAFAGASRWV